jgi:hypothetical protein
MMMADAKFVLGHPDTAAGAKAKLDSRRKTGRERAQELVSVLDRLWNPKVSSLKRKKKRRSTIESCHSTWETCWKGRNTFNVSQKPTQM